MVQLSDFFDQPTGWHLAVVVSVPIALSLALCLCCCRQGLLKFLATAWLWIAFWGSHLVCFVVQLLCLILVCPFLSKARSTELLGKIQQISIFFLITINPFWSVKSENRPKTIPKGAIVMCNHLSYCDAWVTAACLFPVAPKYVAMGSLFKMPLFGWVMKLSGHLPVYFTKDKGGWGVKKGSIQRIMERAVVLLDWGINLFVFPEGSVSKTGEMLPFKDGFFKLAMERKAPILPVACWGNQWMFPPGDQYGMAQPAKVCMRFGTPVQSTDFESVEDLKEHVRHEIETLRNSLPNFNLYDEEEEEEQVSSTCLNKRPGSVAPDTVPDDTQVAVRVDMPDL